MEPADKKQGQPEEQVISLYEKHKTIHVRTVKGWWATWRWVFVYLTQILFYGLPWIDWNGRQAVLFHLRLQGLLFSKSFAVL